MQMPHLTDITGLAGAASAIIAFLSHLPWIKRLAKLRFALLMGAVFVMTLVPYSTLPIAAYIRGATGDLSITTLILLWCALLKPWLNDGTIDERLRQSLLILVAFAAMVLYPLALGFGTFDPYRLGYGNPLFVAVLLLFSLAAWFMEYALVSLCIALATLAWTAGWYESDNLWDYLLDPFVFIYALCGIATTAARKLTDRRQAKPLKEPSGTRPL
jgi:hypothetical protein